MNFYLSRDDPFSDQAVNGHWASGYLLLLKSLADISKFFNETQAMMVSLLNDHQIHLRVLVMNFPFHGIDALKQSEWLLEHRNLLGPECMMHLALTHFSRMDNRVPKFEMLIKRSDFFLPSITYITQAEPKELQAGLRIKFDNEEAIGPGVLHEWFVLVFTQTFTAKNCPFITRPNHMRMFYINPGSNAEAEEEPLHPEFFKFFGRMIALALMHKVHVGVTFDGVLFKQLARLEVQLEDIQDTDPILYKHVKSMSEMDPDEAEKLGLTHETPNEYVHNRFVESTSTRAAQISEGFEDIMPSKDCMMRFFSCLTRKDFGDMLGGCLDNISVEDWKRNTDYNGYQNTDNQIIWFWKIVGKMSQEDLKKLLNFWTAIDYLPLEGFSKLVPRVQINKTMYSTDHIPTSQTYDHIIRLPEYCTYEIMRQRIGIVLEEPLVFGFR